MYQNTETWKRTLGSTRLTEEADVSLLRESYVAFRERVKHLVSDITAELPNLTVHTIEHIDALWDVSDQVIDENFPLNPAEAYVLGGAFLLHDAAHVLAAYPQGKESLRNTSHWRDLVALTLNGVEPIESSDEERQILFNVIRALHAERAAELPFASWKSQNGNEEFLIENSELRHYYGEAIGLVASSHHWDSYLVSERLESRNLSPPAFLRGARWTVDTLKVALILRVVDAAHIDSLRAPKFLLALKNPQGVSSAHWSFQSKLGRPVRTDSGELKISSGSAFTAKDRVAWWLAYDTARMIDREIKDANEILGDLGRKQFAVSSVQGASSSRQFSLQVPVSGWEPIEVAPIVGNIPYLIHRLGGASLYGDKPNVALREVLQNSIDACKAYLALNSDFLPKIHVSLRPCSDGDWLLSVTDNGIGMGRHVITKVLLDFGKSLWSSADVVEEIPGLASAGFKAVGKFGIGFYSVFMLGDDVTVVSRRYERKDGDDADQWQLRFERGLQERPTLSRPGASEKLKAHGTRVSIKISREKVSALLSFPEENLDSDGGRDDFFKLVGSLVPASSVDITCKFRNENDVVVVSSGDWEHVDDATIMSRCSSRKSDAKLLPVRDRSGRLIGRAAPGGRFTYGVDAVAVVGGVAATKVSGLLGLVEAQGNNIDASRKEARIAGSLEDWADWAMRVRDDFGLNRRDVNVQIQAILSEEDLPVWEISGNLTRFSEVMAYAREADALIVHDGPIGHDDDDDMSSTRFASQFEPYDNVVTTPHIWSMSDSSFPWVIGVDEIDYWDMLRSGLRELWGDFLEQEDFIIVGDADGQEITRFVNLFSRVEAIE